MAFFAPSQFINLNGPAAASWHMGDIFNAIGAVQTSTTERYFLTPPAQRLMAVPGFLFGGNPIFQVPPLISNGAVNGFNFVI